MWFRNFCVLYLAAISVYAYDYCSKDLKCQRTPHVGCNNPLANGGWGKACKDGKVVEMSDEIIEAILENQNSRRNQQALGKTPNYEPAVRMATLTWDPELAKLAEMNVRSCVYGHDACENTPAYNVAGQNIALSLADKNYKEKRSDKEVIDDLAAAWFDDEHGNGKYWGWMKFINEFHMPPEDDMKRQIGHFTQVVRDEAYTVGCAATKFITTMRGPEEQAVLLTCNYSLTNIFGGQVYESGPTASKCTSGTNSKYPGLCSTDEKYDSWAYNN